MLLAALVLALVGFVFLVLSVTQGEIVYTYGLFVAVGIGLVLVVVDFLRRR